MENIIVNGHMSIYIFIAAGLITGSFLNVCIYRLPRGESIVFPPSSCPGCGKRIFSRDLIPVFSYLWLKGRCRFCGNKISPVYPSVEILTGLLFACIYLCYGMGQALSKHLFLCAVLIVVSFIDLKHYLIPNRILLFALFGGLTLNIFARDLTLQSIILGFLSAGVFLLLIALVSKGGMGGGDIKLAAVIGIYLGWPGGIIAVFVACLLAGAAGMALLLVRVKSLKDAIPFGPFITLGTLITLFRGNELLNMFRNWL